MGAVYSKDWLFIIYNCFCWQCKSLGIFLSTQMYMNMQRVDEKCISVLFSPKASQQSLHANNDLHPTDRKTPCILRGQSRHTASHHTNASRVQAYSSLSRCAEQARTSLRQWRCLGTSEPGQMLESHKHTRGQANPSHCPESKPWLSILVFLPLVISLAWKDISARLHRLVTWL